MARVIQIPVSDREYEQLAEKANAEGSTIVRYIKDIVIPGNDFQRWFPELLNRVNSLEIETEFNIRAVMATDWVNIPKGIKLSLGRVFYQHVDSGRVANVTPLCMDSAKTQWYQKKEEINEI